MLRELQKKLYLLRGLSYKKLSLPGILLYKKHLQRSINTMLLRGVDNISKSFLVKVILSWVRKIKLHCKMPMINYTIYSRHSPYSKLSITGERQTYKNHSGVYFHNLEQKLEIRSKLQRRTHTPSMLLSMDKKLTTEQIQLLQNWSKQQQKGFFRPTAIINIYLNPTQIDSTCGGQNSSLANNLHDLFNIICKQHHGKIVINIIIDQLYLLPNHIFDIGKNDKIQIISHDLNQDYYIEGKCSHTSKTEITENFNNSVNYSLEQTQTKIISQQYNPEKAQQAACFFFKIKKTITASCQQLATLAENGLAVSNNITCAITINWQQQTDADTNTDARLAKSLNEIKLHAISLRIKNIKNKLQTYLRCSGYIALILAVFYTHSYSKQTQQQRNWLYQHTLSILHLKNSATNKLQLTDIVALKPQPKPRHLLRLWWHNSDNISWQHYNLQAKKLARSLLTHNLTKTYKEKIQQQHLQFKDKNKSLAQFAATVDNYISYQKLNTPRCLDKKTYSAAITNFIDQQQLTANTTANNIKLNNGKDLRITTNWLWPKDCADSIGINFISSYKKNSLANNLFNKNKLFTQHKPDLSQLATTDILSPTWNSNSLLNKATRRLGAIALVYYINQQKLFKRTLSLDKVAANTSIHSKYLLRGLNSPWFYKKNVLPLISSPEPIINIATKYNPHHISIYKLSNNFYKMQFHQDWINFVNSWKINYSNDNSAITSLSTGSGTSSSANNLSWLSNIAAPDNGFSRAVLLAKKEISPANSTSITTQKKHLTGSLINRISKKVGLKPSVTKNSNSAAKLPLSFSDLLAKYRDELSSLYSKLQPMLSNPQRELLSLNYAKNILNNHNKNNSNLPLLQAVDIINKMLNKISDTQARASMRHLLMQPLLSSWKIINNNASKALEKIWQQQIQQQFQKQLATYYPCNPHSNSGADPTLLQQLLFTKDQGLPLFLKQNISPFIKHDPITGALQTPWVTADNGPFRLSLSPKSLQQLEDAQQLLNVLVLNKAPTFFYLHFAITAIPNPNIASLRIQLSKNIFNYNNGPLHWGYYQSNFPYTQRQASIHITTTSGHRILEQHATGPFAPLRILANAKWKCSPGTIECTLSWQHKHDRKNKIKIIMRSANIKYYRELAKQGIKLPRNITNTSLVTN